MEGKEPLQVLIFVEWRQQWRNVWEWEINQWKVHCVMGWGYDYSTASVAGMTRKWASAS